MNLFIQTCCIVLFAMSCLQANELNPVAKCKSSIVKSLDEQTGILMLKNSDIDDGSSDYVSLSLDRLNFGCEDLGKNTVTLTVVDAAGNRDSCTCELEVVKNFGPTAVCIPDSTLTISWDRWRMPIVQSDLIDKGSYDKCTGFTFNVEHNIKICQVEEYSPVILSIIDIAGNSHSCSTIVKVPPYRDPEESLMCWDTVNLIVYPGIEKEIRFLQIVKTNPLFCNHFLEINISDQTGEQFPDWKFSFEDIGKEIFAEVTAVDNNEFCLTRILLESCPNYLACDTLCSNFPGVECEDGLFSQLKWPCDITLTNCIGPTPHTYTPTRLAEITGLDLSSFLPQLNNLECQAIEMYFGDEIVDTPDARFIRRTFRVFIPDMNEWRNYTQVITVPFVPLEICDSLPRDTPLSDCLSGHTNQDMVEWPSNLNVVDTIITLQRLEANYLFGLVPGYENIKPHFENVCAVPEIRYFDKIVENNDTSNIIERTWTVIDPVTDDEYSYVQIINQILFYKAEICLSNPIGDRISNIDLEILNSSSLDSFYYNDSACIELRMKRIPARVFTIFADSLGLEKSMDGVNIVDVVAIRDHYEKTKLFDNKLSEIAAHFGSGSISSSTMLKMLRAITGYPTEVESAQWAIVDTLLYTYPIQNFEYSIYNSTVSVDDPNADLILIKEGDVNFSSINGENIEGEFKISIQDEILNSGELYQIHFLVSSDTDLRAYQVEFNDFNENADQIIWHDVLSPMIFQFSPDNSVFEEKQVVVRRYGYGESFEKKEGDTLFSLEFRALKNGVLSEMLTLYPSENNLAVMPIGQLPKKIVLDWKDRIINNNVEEIELEKISLFPNPASEYLEIKGITSEINYQITDMLGKVCGSGSLSEDARQNVDDLHNGMYILTMMNATGARKLFKFFVAK